MTLFKTLQKETKEIDPKLEERSDYEEFRINDLLGGDTFQGEIHLTDIYENEFADETTGEMVKKYSANLYISNDTNKETLKSRVNMKSLQDNITVWQGSVAYDLIDSLEELNNPGSGGVHNIYKMSYKELQDHINQLGIVSVLVVEHNGKFDYNTLRITQVGV